MRGLSLLSGESAQENNRNNDNAKITKFVVFFVNIVDNRVFFAYAVNRGD